MHSSNLLPQALSAASRAYELRNEVRKQLMTSQAADHEFYKKVSEQVKTATTKVCDFLSNLLQGPVLEVPESRLPDIFCQANVSSEKILEWRQTTTNLQNSYLKLQVLSESLARCKDERSRHSGVLWGSKSGHEYEYQLAESAFNQAELLAQNCRVELDTLRIKAEKIGEELLENCVKNALSIAVSVDFGSGLKEILISAASQASELQNEFNDRQSTLIKSVSKAVGQLGGIYARQS